MRSTPSLSVKSSWVASVSYAGNVLTVTTSHGKAYHYIGVPPTLFSALLASPSKGEFINARIKGKFRQQ